MEDSQSLPSRAATSKSQRRKGFATLHLQNIREYELRQASSIIPEGSRILEIGAGAGWQAKALNEQGFQVEAIDIAGSKYKEDRLWPVLEYDGVHIPFPESHFDVVFSSNVLEHIPHIERFQSEIKRVLKANGVAIHILPTGSWRFWTIVNHYPYILKKAVDRVFSSAPSVGDATKQNKTHEVTQVTRDNLKVLTYSLFPPRHGERGNAIAELFLFSRFSWLPLFDKTGWTVRKYYPVRLFYSGYSVLGARIGIRLRRVLSFILGSSCVVYVLKQPNRKCPKIV